MKLSKAVMLGAAIGLAVVSCGGLVLGVAGCSSTPVVDYRDRRVPVDPIDEFTVLYEEFSAIRLLLAEQSPERTALACTWAREWVDLLESVNRQGVRAFSSKATGTGFTDKRHYVKLVASDAVPLSIGVPLSCLSEGVSVVARVESIRDSVSVKLPFGSVRAS